MADWDEFISKIHDIISVIDGDDCDMPFFRGHRISNWKLQPSLYRKEIKDIISPNFEQNLYCDFILNCGPLYSKHLTPWEYLFEMRHAGLPTRLLDWTEEFSSALYFALANTNFNKKDSHNPCIWILNPIKLNESSYNEDMILFADDLDFEYDDILENKAKKFKGPIAILAPRERQRIFAQKSVFTLHGSYKRPLEQICKGCVYKVEIPSNLIQDAKKYFKLFGISEYSLYPDLDGLGRFLKEKYNLPQDI